MSEAVAANISLTAPMKRALEAIVTFVGRHGTMPSIASLASELGCARSNANRLLDCLAERGALTRTKNGVLMMGGAGVAVVVPPDVAAKLAQFCASNGDRISAVVADAIKLHLDSFDIVGTGE